MLCRPLCLVGVLFSVLLYFPIQSSAQNVELLYILDSSGSMAKEVKGKREIDWAMDALISSFSRIPSSTQVGLRVYGHRVPQNDKTLSCKDSALEVNMGALEPALFKKVLGGLKPKGYTPLAYSLQSAEADFDTKREAKRVIILLSDGEETCGGDPIQVVRDLKLKGFDLVIHTIGFNVDQKTEAMLKQISALSGGSYFDAREVNSLVTAFEEAAKKAVFIERKPRKDYTWGDEIRGGGDYDSAVELPSDRELRLDHNLKPHENDFFYIDVKRGDFISLQLKAGTKGLQCYGTKVLDCREDTHPAGILEVDFNPRELSRARLGVSRVGEAEQKTLVALEDARWFVRVTGTNGGDWAMHREAITFAMKRSSAPQVNGGDKLQSAFSLKMEEEMVLPQRRLFSDLKDKEFYTFELKAGETLKLSAEVDSKKISIRRGIVRESGNSGSYNEVLDEDGKFLQYWEIPYLGSIEENGGLYRYSVSSKSGGRYLLKIAPKYEQYILEEGYMKLHAEIVPQSTLGDSSAK